MNNKPLITFSLVLIAMLALAARPGSAKRARGPVWAGLLTQETPLAPTGEAYELNLDSQGKLWVSDMGAGQIRSYNPASGAYTTYYVGGGPSDARGDGAGSVWWADYRSNRLGRLSTSTNQATIWEIPGSAGLYGTAIDSSGDVWVSDAYAPVIYKLDPHTNPNQLCTYALPGSAGTDYLYIKGQQLWFGDSLNARIVRLQSNTFNWWQLPEDSYPHHLELDESGDLWWTDREKRYLGRLDSSAATITTFTPPTSGTPEMLTQFDGKVWYSQQDPSRVVVLDPAVAAGQSTPVTPGSQAATPTCSPLPPLAPTAVTTTSGQASWTGRTYTTAVDAAGWKMYSMPANSVPWGISSATDKIWLVDRGRHVLARLSTSAPSYTIEKQMSVDGGTTWVDADSKPGPDLLKGNDPRFRVTATNTGNVAITVDVSDPGLPALDITGVTLVVGATDVVIAGPVTGTWAEGQHTNTATVDGTYIDPGSFTWTESQTDDANYFGADPSYTIEKQVSVDGGTSWVDADSIAGPKLLKGNAPRFRVTATNTGNVAITVDVSDPDLPALDITSVTLVVGATDVVVAGPVTGTWAEGQQTNTATAGGSYADDGGHGWTGSHTDDANYLGANPSEHEVHLPMIVKP